MSNSSGAIKFQDGTIRFYEYHGTSDCIGNHHYATLQEVSDNWRKSEHLICECGQEEVVSIYSGYNGYYYKGKACRYCNSVHGESDPDSERGDYIEDKDQTWYDDIPDPWAIKG